MEQLGKEDIERLIFFEQAREQAEKECQIDPRNTGALTRWGGSLLELAHFRQGHEAFEMIEEAVEKFNSALKVDATKHDTLWCLGNAYTSQGFLTTDTRTAQRFFDKATDCFKKALKEDPSSTVYQKALDMTSKAPALHAELQRQLAQPQLGEPSGARQAQGQKSAVSDWWYDVAGWGILVGIGVAVVALTRSQAAAPAAPLAAAR